PLRSAPGSGKSALSTARAAFWCSRCGGGAVAALKVSSRKATPTPSAPPTCRSVAGVHGLPLTISANRASRTRTTYPSWASRATAEEPLLLGAHLSRVGGEPSKGPAELRQDLAGVARVEQVHGGEVVPLDDADLQVAHEPGRGHAEVVADQGQALHVLAVALPQGPDQLGVRFRPLGVQPLLELVKDQHDFEAVRSDRIHTVGERRDRINAVTTDPAPPQIGEGLD